MKLFTVMTALAMIILNTMLQTKECMKQLKYATMHTRILVILLELPPVP